ncbi:unnamed protein product [Rotaria sp. Silwood2]|nr:unnamed protein product [Rotaria sp. Silwood2]
MASTNFHRCPFHKYGCKDPFPQDQIKEHYLSQAHFKSMINLICFKRIKYEDALIDLAINSFQGDTLLSSGNTELNNYLQLIERLTTVVAESVTSSNLTNVTSNAESYTDQTFNPIQSRARDLIIETDKNPNCTSTMESHQRLDELNNMMMNQIFSRIESSSNVDEVNQHREQNEQQQTSSINNEHNTIQFNGFLNDMFQIELENTPVSTDGNLVLRIDNVFTEAEDLTIERQLCINSKQFQAFAGGQRLFARVHLNGKINTKFISFHMHLNFPVRDTFIGHIKFILVDQSDNYPLKHIIKYCSAKMYNVNDCIGFDDFIDKTHLRQESHRYIPNNAAYFIVCVEQPNEEKLIHYPTNVRDAICQSYLTC